MVARAAGIPAADAVDCEPIRPGRIYLAPPDRHLLVEAGRVRIGTGPRQNHQRPAVDPLFRSAAHAYGARVVGVILTGLLDDGTAGLLAVKAAGGIAVVQDPADAAFRGMPDSALAHVDVDYQVPLAAMGPLIERLTRAPVAQPGAVPSSLPHSLGVEQIEDIERALYAALRALEERAAVWRQMAERARARNPLVAARYDERADECDQNVASLLALLVGRRSPLRA